MIPKECKRLAKVYFPIAAGWATSFRGGGAIPLQAARMVPMWSRTRAMVLPMSRGRGRPAANVVGTGDGWLAELSTTELKGLFALR